MLKLSFKEKISSHITRNYNCLMLYIIAQVAINVTLHFGIKHFNTNQPDCKFECIDSICN